MIGTPWTITATEKLCKVWSKLVRSANLEGEFFKLDERKVLLNVNKSWMLKDIIKFVLFSKETEKLELDGKIYKKDDFDFDDEDDDDDDEL